MTFGSFAFVIVKKKANKINISNIKFVKQMAKKKFDKSTCQSINDTYVSTYHMMGKDTIQR
ncbi:hypothetical protein T07_6017 [Trichinella nelsoni]|uniref:Uncharacterized protein n=1 Tax=Trichinella nelsoni TaxID=6336 RepID=A0A0V0RP16_9BILA|nr:hypothetical protein T07_6017 [Trichinella nelsoni]